MKRNFIFWLIPLLVAAAVWSASEHSYGEIAPAAGQAVSVDPELEKWRAGLENDGREVYVRRREIVAAIGLRPGMTVADIGAGTGLFTRLFAQEVAPGGRVYAVDLDAASVEKMMQLVRAANLHDVVGVVNSETDAKLPPASLDLAYICDVYHHFDHPEQMLQSIYRALKPGAKLVLVDFERIPGKSPQWILEHVPARFDKQSVIRDFENAGFRFVEEKKLPLRINYFVEFRRPQSGAAAALTTAR